MIRCKMSSFDSSVTRYILTTLASENWTVYVLESHRDFKLKDRCSLMLGSMDVTPICEMNVVLLVSMLQEEPMVIIWAGVEFKRHKDNSKNCKLKSQYSPFKKCCLSCYSLNWGLVQVRGDDRQRRQCGAGAHYGWVGKLGKQPLL